MKNYQFRAVYIKQRGEETEYTSLPLNEVKEMCDTIGVYEVLDSTDSFEKRHVIDMSREEFQEILEIPFPNGFVSWERTYFELTRLILSALNDEQSEIYTFLQFFKQNTGIYDPQFLASFLTRKFENENNVKNLEGEDFRKKLNVFLETEMNKLSPTNSGKV